MGSLTKEGAGILALTGINTYSGGTAITNGGLNANGPTAFGTGSVLIDGSNSVLNATGTNITNASTPGQNPVMVINGATLNLERGSIAANNSNRNGIMVGETQGGPNTVNISSASISSAFISSSGSAILAEGSLAATITLNNQMRK